PVLQITDLTGRVLAESGSGVLGYKFEKDGSYALTVRDKEYRGGTDFLYRLHAGDLPVVTSVFPLSVERGRTTEVTLNGVNLGEQRTVKVVGNGAPGSKVPVPAASPKGAPLGSPTVVVGEFPEVSRFEDGSPLSLGVPGTGNGRIGRAGAGDVWGFSAK